MLLCEAFSSATGQGLPGTPVPPSGIHTLGASGGTQEYTDPALSTGQPWCQLSSLPHCSCWGKVQPGLAGGTSVTVSLDTGAVWGEMPRFARCDIR